MKTDPIFRVYISDTKLFLGNGIFQAFFRKIYRSKKVRLCLKFLDKLIYTHYYKSTI